MVVDDDDGFRGLAKRILSGCGYRPEIEASSVCDALQKVQQSQPDLALVDVGLPDGDGLELSRELRAAAPTMRVVLVSADSDATTQQRAKDAGAVGFVAKSELSCTLLHSLLNNE